MTALECIACGRELEDAVEPVPGVNQPHKGTAFASHGHYGSTAFDPMDGHSLEINICDPCLLVSAKKNRVLIHPPGCTWGEEWDGAAQGTVTTPADEESEPMPPPAVSD